MKKKLFDASLGLGQDQDVMAPSKDYIQQDKKNEVLLTKKTYSLLPNPGLSVAGVLF